MMRVPCISWIRRLLSRQVWMSWMPPCWEQKCFSAALRQLDCHMQSASSRRCKPGLSCCE
eukprot:1157486-Pelagomonas_calceolata.AAC.3